jgi:outer membrane receptor protein involved in Fe transport
MDGNIAIQPGDRIPQIPQHMLKAYAEWQATRKLSGSLDFVAISSSYARGNENNLHQADGVYYFGPGTTPGYGLVNLGARYQLQKKLQLFVQVNNLLDHRYYTAGQLGPTPFDNSYQFAARPFPAVDGNYPIRSALFVAPGAPITVFGGIRFHF